MTVLQKIALRISEVRQRLNAIAGIEGEAFTDEIRAEAATLQTEYGDLETRHRAAIVAEGDAEARARAEFAQAGGEAAEIRQLRDRAPLSSYILTAVEKRGLIGPEGALNDALKVSRVGSGGGPVIPFSVIHAGMMAARPRPQGDGAEARAFTTAAGLTAGTVGSVQRPILQELFGPGIFDMLGIRVDSVPSGMSNWPLLTGNTAPALFKDGTAATDAVAASFTVAELKPKRLSAEMELSHELIGSVLGVENEFRNNLMAALKAQMNDLVLNGAAPNAQKPHLIEGFITRLAENNDSAIADAARYGRLHAAAVDGIHAENEREVMGVIGVASYTHAAGVYIAGSGKSGSQLLAERSGGCMASSYIPAKNGNHQQAILHAAGPNGGGGDEGRFGCGCLAVGGPGNRPRPVHPRIAGHRP